MSGALNKDIRECCVLEAALMSRSHNKDIRECVCAGGCTDGWGSQQGHQGVCVCWRLH
jgi:hypothetical protein